jgi:hypothetical protein
MPEPENHLFTARDGWGETSLWWGTGPDDRHCELVELGGTRSNMSIAASKALWAVIASSSQVVDYSDVDDSDSSDERHTVTVRL